MGSEVFIIYIFRKSVRAVIDKKKKINPRVQNTEHI